MTSYRPDEIASIIPRLSPGAQLEVRALLAEQRLAALEADAVQSVEAESLPKAEK